MENARQSQITIIDTRIKDSNTELKKLNKSRVKEANVMKRDMEAVTKAQANYTNLLKAHFKEAQEIHIRTSKVFEQNNKNKGQGAEAELAEFEMYRTANALEAMKIDSSEMVKAAKDSIVKQLN